MSRSEAKRALQIELLQARAAVERAELANALQVIDTRTRKVRSVTSALGGVADHLRNATPTILHLLRLLREHPWVLSTIAAILARRPLKRLLALGIVVGALYLALGIARRRVRFGPRR